METEQLSSDRISTLPQNIIENILTLMPIRDALRTSILSKKWKYSWRTMPKLAFINMLPDAPYYCDCNSYYGCGRELGHILMKKYKLVNAIFHVLLLHNGPEILEFDFSASPVQMVTECDQIISYLSRGNSVKELILIAGYDCYNLPVSFFSVQGLESLHLENCKFEPPLIFNGFSTLRRIKFMNVAVSAKTLQSFLSTCSQLDHVCLNGQPKVSSFESGETKFSFVEFFQCVPLIKSLDVSKYYMKYLCAGGMPHQLSTSLAHLKYLCLDVCLMEHDEISSALCMIRSSPLLVEIKFQMYDNKKMPVRQTPTNFLDVEDYSDMKLDRLETFNMDMFSNLPIEMEFVKLIMAKSPVLKKVQIKLDGNVSVDEEVKLLRVLVMFPIPRASPSAKLIIKR